MSKHYLYIVIVVLLGFNIYLMFQFHTISDATGSQKYLSAALQNVNRLILEGNSLIKEFGDLGENEVSHQVGYDLHFFFRNSDCSACIKETYKGIRELKQLSKINKVYLYFSSNGNIPSYKDVIAYSGINLPVKKVNYTKVMNNLEVTITPFLLVTNANSSKVIDAYLPEPGNLIMREAFLKKWRSLLSDRKEQALSN